MPLVLANDWQTTLAAAVADGAATTITVTDPAPPELRRPGARFVIRIEDEFMLVTDASDATAPFVWTIAANIGRGFDLSAPVAHTLNDSGGNPRKVDVVASAAALHAMGSRLDGWGDPDALGWRAISYPYDFATLDTGDLGGNQRFWEIPYREGFTSSIIGFQIRGTVLTGGTNAEMALYLWTPGATTLERIGANIDMSAVFTSTGFKEISCVRDIPWEPGFRLFAGERQAGTTTGSFRARTKMVAELKTGVPKISSTFPVPAMNGTGNPLPASVALSGLAADDNYGWVGLR